MKTKITATLIFILSLVTIVALSKNNYEDYIDQASGIAKNEYKELVYAGCPVNINYIGISLKADTAILLRDTEFSISGLRKTEIPLVSSYIVNVTGDIFEGYRLLPHGVHFSEPAMLIMQYDPTLIPSGYKPSDINTYYYDEIQKQWQALQRVRVDTIKNEIYSLTTHFTDFINAIVKTPDMPETSAYLPTTMSDMDYANPMQGVVMVAEPKANNHGTANLTYPIEIPLGRNGMQPNLVLQYNSEGGTSAFGEGWEMSLQSISVSTKWGVPRYDMEKETEQYLLNGEEIVVYDDNGVALPQIQNTNILRDRVTEEEFHERRNEQHNRIIRHGDNPTNYWWEVVDRSGTRHYFGKSHGENELDTTAVLRCPDLKVIAYWAHTESVDLFGNSVKYHYNLLTDNQLEVDSIRYTNSNEIDGVHLIKFHYKDRELQNASYRYGFKTLLPRLTCSIDVFSVEYDFYDELRRYYFLYELPTDYSTQYKSLLTTIYKVDNLSGGYVDCYCLDGPYDGDYNSIASTTHFEYEAMPASSDLFGETHSLGTSKIYRSTDNSWGVNTGVGVGLGAEVYNKRMSVSGSFKYGNTTVH